MSETVKSATEKIRDTPSLVDRVYTHLLNRIITGAIRYGEAISIKAVAAELSVSSMPVREAVKRLEFEGVVTIKPRSSCRVRVPSRKTILEVYQVREALEGYAVLNGSGRRDPAVIGRLRVIVEKMRLLSTEPSADMREQRAIELDRQFHAEIIGLAGNELLDSISRQLSVHVNMTLMHEKTYHALEGRWAEMHAEIVDCLESDPQRAVALLRAQFAEATDLWKANGHGTAV
jgi:DNA-binding GntR family transcriptional regulator